MVKSWNRGFDVAKAASVYSNAPRKGQRLGAAIFSGNKLLSIGFNVWNQTHTNSASHPNYNHNIHAEHKAVLKRQYFDSPGNTIYVYRETHDGKPACSKPCLNCLNIINESGIKRVRFINKLGNAEEMSL